MKIDEISLASISPEMKAKLINQLSCHHNYELSFLFHGLDSRNGTYASMAFISGVGH